ncbi:hypothetical protein CBG25_18730 [Arsenophonus sp. ENCA]|uniref:hypothetical protein n=1 Tax=Arsenophonus sp. ENCA TaxID=1987579 RepID=UPI000BC8D9BA|nr:hypothetical protein [Arsenophonus sp. ENCA]PAV01088.1 hypothetical protein CBG25_18730 [Arsenophonus sp. ENCA]
MKRALTAMVLATLISGCSSQWVRINLNAEDFSLAKSFCEKQSENKFPVKNEVAQRTHVKHHEIWQKKEKYQTVLIPEIDSYVIDVNKHSRRQFFYHCMNQKGWKSETKWL